MEGACMCKAIKVKVNDDNLFGDHPRGHVCHCANCRKVSGSDMGATNLIIETEKVQISGEENLKCFDDFDTLSGNPVHRYFCKNCGVPIRSMTKSMEGKTILKLGISPKMPKPEWESFAAHRQDWGRPMKDTVQYHTKSKGELWSPPEEFEKPL